MPRDEAYWNPVDRKIYVSSGWHTHKPTTRRPDDPARKVKLEHVWLLTPERLIGERTTSAGVVAFVREAERLAEETFGKSGTRFRVMVQFTCEPGGHKVQMVHQDGPTALLQQFYDALITVEPLPVKSDDVTFQFELSVSP